jgi:hypothetical protein
MDGRKVGELRAWFYAARSSRDPHPSSLERKGILGKNRVYFLRVLQADPADDPGCAFVPRGVLKHVAQCGRSQTTMPDDIVVGW